MASSTSPRFNYLKTIKTKACGLPPELLEKTALDGNGSEVPVLRIGGRITSAEKGKTGIGEYTKFKGEFEGINILTGEHYRSQGLTVTPVAEQLLSDIFSDGKEGAVQFGLDITVVKHDSAQKGGWKFKYGVKSLASSKTKDALSQLMDSFDEVAALPAPSAKRAKKE